MKKIFRDKSVFQSIKLIVIIMLLPILLLLSIIRMRIYKIFLRKNFKVAGIFNDEAQKQANEEESY